MTFFEKNPTILLFDRFSSMTHKTSSVYKIHRITSMTHCKTWILTRKLLERSSQGISVNHGWFNMDGQHGGTCINFASRLIIFQRKINYERKSNPSACRFLSPVICHFWSRSAKNWKKNSHENFLCGHVEHRFDNSAEKSFLKIRKNIEIYKPSQVFFSQKISPDPKNALLKTMPNSFCPHCEKI